MVCLVLRAGTSIVLDDGTKVAVEKVADGTASVVVSRVDHQAKASTATDSAIKIVRNPPTVH